MNLFRLFFLVFMVVFVVAPVYSQTQETLLACDPGQYWLSRIGYTGTGVWQPTGHEGEFRASWSPSAAFLPWAYGTVSVTFDANTVRAAARQEANEWGLGDCTFEGTLGIDGASIYNGTSVCQTAEGEQTREWSATIYCAPPIVSWNQGAVDFTAAVGQQFSYYCPPYGWAPPLPLVGTGIYQVGGAVCGAAVHAGLITLEEGGTVAFEMLPEPAAYEGSESNEIVSLDWIPRDDFFYSSYQFIGVTGEPPQIDFRQQAILWRGKVSQQYQFLCLRDNLLYAEVIGDGIYSDTSSICAAAVYEGVIGWDGGLVTIEMLPGQASYESGGQSNGVTSFGLEVADSTLLSSFSIVEAEPLPTLTVTPPR
jgi:hypothetical protein